MKSLLGQKQKIFVKALFVLKNDSQVIFSTRRGPQGLKRVKNSDLKIWSKLVKIGPLAPTPPEEKIRFLDPNKFFMKKVAIDSACPKTFPGHFLGLPRDRGKRNSPQQMKSLLGQKQKIFVKALFVLKNDSQVIFSTRRGPQGLKRVKNSDLKIWSKLVKIGPLAPTPPEEKIRFLDPNKFFMKKVAIDSACPKTFPGHFLGLPRDRGQRNSPQQMKSLLGQKQKIFVKALFVLKNDSQVIFSTRRGPQGLKRVKNSDLKIWSKLVKIGPLAPTPPEEKIRFLDPNKFFMKKVAIDSACPKTFPGHFLGLPRDRGQRNSPQQMKSLLGQKQKIFVKALFVLKNDSQVIFSTRRGPQGLKRVKNSDLKIWSKLVKIGPLAPTPPEEKIRFLDPNKFFMKKVAIDSACPKTFPGHFLGLPRDRGQRNSPQQMKSLLGQKQKIFVKALFVLKNDSQVIFSTRRGPQGLKRVKNSDLKIWSKLVKIGPLAPTPPEEKIRFLDPNKFFMKKVAIDSACPKTFPGHFLGLPRDRGQRNSPQQMKSLLGQKQKIFVKALFVLKNDSQVIFSTRRGPQGLKRVKNSDLKIWSKLVKIGPLAPTPPEEKIRFLDPNKFFMKKVAIDSACPKTFPGHFLGLPRDRGQRNSPQQMKSLLGQKQKIFVKALFVLKNDSQVIFSTRRGPQGLKRVKNSDLKIWSKLVKIGPLAPTPPEEKIRFLDPNKFFMKKVAIDSACPKTFPGHFLGLPRDRGQRNSPQQMKSLLGQKQKIFVKALFVLKNDSQVIFSTRRGPQGLKRVKNPDLKIWSKLALSPLPPQRKKFDFWTPTNFS